MEPLRSGILVLIFSLCWGAGGWERADGVLGARAELVVVSANRTIDMRLHELKETTIFKLKNTGEEVVGTFVHSIPEALMPKMAFFKAAKKTAKTDEWKQIRFKFGAKKAADGASTIEITVKGGIKPKKSVTLKVRQIFVNTLEPQSEIKQGDPALMVYGGYGSHYIPSTYQVATQTTTIKMKGPAKHITPLSPYTVGEDDTLILGPYEDVKPGAHSPLSVSFEATSSMPVATRLVRTATVSHWKDRVAIEDFLAVKNILPPNSGEFSRLDFDLKKKGKTTAFQLLTLSLPWHAEPKYFKDHLGLISSKAHQLKERKMLFQMMPRFPIIGGWKAELQYGYDEQLSQRTTLSNNGVYNLEVPFGLKALETIPIDEFELHVVLPEGAKDIKASAGFKIETSETTSFKFFDTVGRPTVVVKKSNVIAVHSDSTLTISYSLKPFSLVRKPLVLTLGFAAFFFLLFLLNRMDLTLVKTDDKLKVT